MFPKHGLHSNPMQLFRHCNSMATHANQTGVLRHELSGGELGEGRPNQILEVTLRE